MAIAAYNGEKSYAFISYAHKDSKRVMEILEKMGETGCRIWYDEGIAPGSEWPEDIAQHLTGASVVIAFISRNSVNSANCRREINYALGMDKPFLGIMLEETEMTAGMELQLSAQQCILRHNFKSEEAFLDKILSSSIMGLCRDGGGQMPASVKMSPKKAKKKWPLAVAAVFVLAVAVVLGMMMGSRGEKTPALPASEAAAEAIPVPSAAAEMIVPPVAEETAAEDELPAAEEETAAVDTAALKMLRAGDTLRFGRYEQDDEDGDFDEPIEWLVLEKKDGTLLIVSEKLLDCRPYCEEYGAVTWENSPLRQWLNEDFYENAFSEEEKKLIARSSLRNRKNPSYGTSGGEDTLDKVFLLSFTDATTYFEGAKERCCEPSDFAYAEADSKDAAGNAWWWLRTPGQDGRYALGAADDGSVQHGGYQTGNNGYIRPAICLKIE